MASSSLNSLIFDSGSDSEDERLVKAIKQLQEEEDAFLNRVPFTRTVIRRLREETAENLFRDYFAETPVFKAPQFRRRYRMRIQLFLRITHDITHYTTPNGMPPHFYYFTERYDCCNRKSFTTLQKVTSAIRQLAYGTAADMFDEYLHMSEQVSLTCLDNFCRCVSDLYKSHYLRSPNAQDVARLYSAHEQKHGFKGMLGSIDCMHWEWKNCPVAHKGQYTRGDHKKPTLMLEAVASHDLWIWHAFFGMAGSNNDINVLNQSPLFDNLKKGIAPPTPFEVNGHEYTHGYYLADGIYPDWATLVKGWSAPVGERKVKYTRFQSAARKDIERAFGVLQGRFHILKLPSRKMGVNIMRRIMTCCLILHNMIIEDNGFALCGFEEDLVDEHCDNPSRRVHTMPRDPAAVTREIKDKNVHDQLHDDLIEHIWNLPSNFRQHN